MNSSTWGTQLKYGEFEIAGARENRPMLLGEGIFGKTFEGVRMDGGGGSSLRKFVALKVLNPDLFANHAKRFQFIQELLLLTDCKHPNLLQYLRCGEEKGEVFYATELCRGGDLAKLARRFGPLPERVVALIGSQVAAGLKELHQRHRLVHRDLKPSNIVLAEELGSDLIPQQLAHKLEQQEGLCRVADFALVTFALNAEDSPQRFAGSAMYASPEQIREQPVDGRCDLFALGMTLWYLLQGKGPLLDEGGSELLDPNEMRERQIGEGLHDKDLPADLSPAFQSILSRLVAKLPEQRFSSAAELQSSLKQYLDSGAKPASSGARRCENAMLVRIDEPLESVYNLEERLSARGTHNSYSAKEKMTGRRVKVNVVSQVDGAGAAELAESLAGRLCKFAELSKQPLRPEALLPVQSVLWATDLLAYSEDMYPHVALSELLKARNSVKRPVGFAEAVTILKPIAEALDYLLQNGQEAIAIPCEEVWLTGGFVETLPPNGTLPTIPLSEWEALQVRISMVFLPQQSQEELPDASGSTIGRTMSGSLQMSAADSHPVPVFARLVYRVLNGSEVAAAVQFAPYAFVPAVTLSYASNNLIRDIISRQRPWIDTMTLLKDLCAKEGVILRAGNNPAVARVVSPGVVQSPYAAVGSTQQLSAEEWVPGGEFTCNESGRKVLLPMELPSLEKIASSVRPPVQNSVHETAKDVPNERWLNADQARVSQKAGQFREVRSEPVRKKPPVAPPRVAPQVRPVASPPPLPAVPERRSPMAWVLGLLLLVAALGAGGWHYFGPLIVPGPQPGVSPTPIPDSTPTPPPLPIARNITNPPDSGTAELAKEATPVPARVIAAVTPVEKVNPATPVPSTPSTPVPVSPKAAPKPLVTLADIKQALAKNPADGAALLALGEYQLARKDLPRAKAAFTEAMEASPQDPKPLARRGLVWALSGSPTEADNDYQAALAIDPRDTDALVGLGGLSFERKDYANAALAFSAALKVNPNFTEALVQRARCFRHLLRLDLSRADYERYIALKPDDPAALSEYAWMLATSAAPSIRDGAKAKVAAYEANKLTGWTVPDYLDTYAAALAESGSFDEAIRCQNEAITRAAREKDSVRSPLEARLELYKQKKPYHQSGR